MRAGTLRAMERLEKQMIAASTTRLRDDLKIPATVGKRPSVLNNGCPQYKTVYSV